MNPDSPQTPRDEMEQRLTALLLGELSAEEAAAVHRAMAQDGELAKLFARLHHTVGLVRETVTSPSEPVSAQVAPAKLSTARREKLLAHFKTVAPKEFAPEKRQVPPALLALAAAIVILGLLAALALPTLSKMRGSVASGVDESHAELAASAALVAAAPVAAAAPTIRPSTETESFTMGGAPAQAHLGYQQIPPVSFGISGTEPEELRKRPVAVTPRPAKPTTSIALPALPQNYGYWAADSSDRESLALGAAPEQNRSFYRITTSADGDEGERATMPRTAGESQEIKGVDLAYTSPGSGAAREGDAVA